MLTTFQVKHYQGKKTLETEVKLEEEKKRLIEIKTHMEEQAKKDAERFINVNV